MTTLEKCVAVLARVSRPASDAAALDDAEQADVAAIYDACLAPKENAAADLDIRFDAVWAARRDRLEKAKAADETSDDA